LAGSGPRKKTALAQRTLDHRASLSCALVCLRLVHHDDVDRHFKVVQRGAQADGLLDRTSSR
jgi:hypothetical protein